MRKFAFIIAAFSFLATAGLSLAAGNKTLSVTATVLSKSNCKFTTAASALNFGNLDPLNPVNKVVNASVVFRCGGSTPNATFFISQDPGLYKTGPGANRMRHATVLTEYLPYSLALNPITNTVPRNVNQTLTINETVNGVDYQGSYAGSFSDTVVLSIAP